MTTKPDRLLKANRLLRGIASCGRMFFRHDGKISQFELDAMGRVWFRDEHSGRRVYTHYSGEWRGFTNGGTMRNLVCHLRDFIRAGKMMPDHTLGPWPAWYCNGDLWGYGEHMDDIRELARDLGSVRPSTKESTPCLK